MSCLVHALFYQKLPYTVSVLCVECVPCPAVFVSLFPNNYNVSCPCWSLTHLSPSLGITEDPPLERFVIAMQLRVYQRENENQFLPLGITRLD